MKTVSLRLPVHVRVTRDISRASKSRQVSVSRLQRKRKKESRNAAKGISQIQENIAPDDISENIAKAKVSRRTFLKASAAATAIAGTSGAILTLSHRASAQVPTEETLASTTGPFAAQIITLNINGNNIQVEVEPREMLVNVLRDDTGLIGTKRPCNRMECGACTVLIDETPYNSCQYMVLRAQSPHKIMTVEANNTGQLSTPDPVLAALQNAWVENDGGQCSYCASGFIMASTALLKQNATPTVADIQQALLGHLCRCGNYLNIISAVQMAAQSLAGGT